MRITKQKEIVMTLHKKTMEGVVDWTKTTNLYTFTAQFPSGKVDIMQGEDEEMDYCIYLYNSEGILIEGISPKDLEEELLDTPKIFKQIYTNARSKALNLDIAAEQLLEEIRKIN